MIHIEGLSKEFKTSTGNLSVLKDIHLTIHEGDITGIIGLSGAGKSTLLRIIGGLDTPTKGHVTVGTKDLTALSSKEKINFHKEVGTVFQGYNLLMQKNVFDNIALPLSINKCSKPTIRQRVTELLKLVDLEDKALAYPAQLSGGQKQRVAIARALANHPKILLCDEPTSALDCITTRSILNLLQSINAALGVTVVIITHDIDVVKSICNKVVVLHEAEVVESGKTECILHTPHHSITQKFLA